MEMIQTRGDLRSLRDPVLVAGFASPGNTTPASAIEALLAGAQAEVVAEFDNDELYDFTVARPLVRVEQGQRVLDWPQLLVYRVALRDRDVLLMTGIEPHFRWQAVARALADLARWAGVREAVVLSSFNAATLHTRRSPLMWVPQGAAAGTRRFGQPASLPRYQGPATFTMALGRLLVDEGVAAGTLNAMAPFYLGVDPSPHAARALADAVAEEFGLPVDLRVLDAQIEEVARQAQAQIQASPPLAEFISNLEQQFDQSQGWTATEATPPTAPKGAESLPESSSVLAGVEALLREHRGDLGGGGAGPRGRRQA
jgi:predicted ATP-grasp superfamily ATP-dependent carboligase